MGGRSRAAGGHPHRAGLVHPGWRGCCAPGGGEGRTAGVGVLDEEAGGPSGRNGAGPTLWGPSAQASTLVSLGRDEHHSGL